MINKTNDNVDKWQPCRRKRIHDTSTIEFHTSREKIVWGDHSPAVRGGGGGGGGAIPCIFPFSGNKRQASIGQASIGQAKHIGRLACTHARGASLCLESVGCFGCVFSS